LFSSDQLEQFWDELDAFEGEGYKRELTTVVRKDKSEVSAFVYCFNHECEDEYE